jgi:hypothetical protein
MVALADSHGGVEVCLTTFLRPIPWEEDGSRPISGGIFNAIITLIYLRPTYFILTIH